MNVAANPQQVQSRIGYMPQKFGLYADLSVQENLDLYADLHGVGADERRERYPRLMEMTALASFREAFGGPAFRRDEAETRTRLHAHSLTGTGVAR